MPATTLVPLPCCCWCGTGGIAWSVAVVDMSLVAIDVLRRSLFNEDGGDDDAEPKVPRNPRQARLAAAPWKAKLPISPRRGNNMQGGKRPEIPDKERYSAPGTLVNTRVTKLSRALLCVGSNSAALSFPPLSPPLVFVLRTLQLIANYKSTGISFLSK